MPWNVYPFAVWAITAFCLGRGTEMMWPEWSPWTWWAIGAFVPVIGFGAPAAFRRWLAPRLPSGVSKGLAYFWGDGLPRDLFPFVEAADMVWPDIRKETEVFVQGDFDGAPLHHIWWEMFKGKEFDVPLYASRPPAEKLGVIENAHEYELSKDFNTATNDFLKDRKTITNLMVRRKYAKKWVKNYLNDPSDDGAVGRE